MESGVGFGLLSNDVRQRQLGGGKGFEQHFFAYAVHGGVNIIQAAFGFLRQRGGFGDVGFNYFFAECFVVAAAGILVDGGLRGLVNQCGDLFIGGGDDLPAAVAFAQIDFVAVVSGGVMAGGYHHACAGVKVLNGIGKHGGGQFARQQAGLDACGCHDFGGVAGVDVGIFAPVVANHDAGGLWVKLQDVVCQPFGSLGNQHAVHAHAACLLFAAQTCGAKLQASVEAVFQLA